jgi:sarcosine oxidase
VERSGRIAVVGAGVEGAAAARALARRGHDVVVLEQFEPGHARGGSHGATRIFRLTYAEPEYVRLAQESLDGWRELAHESGERLLELNGLLEVARDLAPVAAALDACGVAWEELDADAARARFGIALPDGMSALLQGEAGVVFAERALSAFLAGARAHGATVRPRTFVLGIEPNGDSVRLATSAGDVHADVVVVAAGAWADRLLAPLGVHLELRPTRETVVYVRLDHRTPSLIEEDARPRGESAYALHDPAHGLKAGLHRAGRAVDPDVETAPDPELVEMTVSWVAERFPGADVTSVRAETCLYANRPEERFALERRGPVVVASACSGHGFKFAPAIGERIAGLAEEALVRGSSAAV